MAEHIPTRLLFWMVERDMCPPNSVYVAVASSITGIEPKCSVQLCGTTRKAAGVLRTIRITSTARTVVYVTPRTYTWLAITDAFGRTSLVLVMDLEAPSGTRKNGVKLQIAFPKTAARPVQIGCMARIREIFLVNLMVIDPTWQAVDVPRPKLMSIPYAIPNLYQTRAAWFFRQYTRFVNSL